MIGEVIGPCLVLSKLGAGGMGEVYRARDTSLDRDVAIKVLPAEFASDPERLARFEREAKVLASLNHPNIAQIYGLEKSGDTPALILELVEGPTLADRISQGAIALDEALPIARQIAEALEAAHEQGIIHRDLKPANIKVTPDGVVKVLDFGLAKALTDVGSAGASAPATDADLAESPTMSMSAAATRAGFILGTAAYMSPEQARGKPVDKRTDIWAFGVVLYEILVGRPAFDADDVSLTLAEVMKSDVDLTRLPADCPAPIATVVRRCLVKEPRQRIRDIGDVRLAMEGAFETVAAPPVAASGESPRAVWQRPASAVGILLAAVTLAGLAGWLLRQPPLPASPVYRFSVVLPEGDSLPLEAFGPVPAGVAVSPDGTSIVYAAARGGHQMLFSRSRDQLEPMPIRGTEGATYPFFSPDGEWVGFFTDEAIKKVALAGGVPVTLCASGRRRGASWAGDLIVFASDDYPGLMQVPAAGGEPTPLTTPEEARHHLWPAWLPGGKAVVFTAASLGLERVRDAGRVMLLDVSTGRQQELTAGTSPRYSTSGHLLFARGFSLWASPFDVERLRLTGEPAPVLDGVRVGGAGLAHYDVSAHGTLVYRPATGVDTAGWRLVSVDPAGRTTAIVTDQRDYVTPRVSPDGLRIAVAESYDVGTTSADDVWMVDVGRGTVSRFTTAGGTNPVWSSDGSRVAYRGADGLYVKAADGSGTAKRLAAIDGAWSLSSWSRDGTLAVSIFRGSRRDIWMVPSGGEPTEFLATEYDEAEPVFSPDGRWLAYVSNESGQAEVYVRPYPGPGGPTRVSPRGGAAPSWRPDGRALVYREGLGDLMVVPVTTDPALVVGEPSVFVRDEGGRSRATGGSARNYDLFPDGERIVVLVGDRVDAAADSFTVVVNWDEEISLNP